MKVPKDSKDTQKSEFEEQEELQDPALFEELNQPRIPKLEKLARNIAEARRIIKTESEKDKGWSEQAVTIMNDNEITHYKYKDVLLDLSSKVKLAVSVD